MLAKKSARAICERYGLVGVFPAVEEGALDPALSLNERALVIRPRHGKRHAGHDAMIVNLTPFRGPGADVGAAH
jgi:nucleoside 2-deoxyribosyltransferase